MGILSGFVDIVTSINWEVIANLLFVSLIMIAGPAVIFVLAFSGGDM
ncbi:MAG: photosystem II reaction center protein Ycf12 [Spirulinaceae cyanobacterium]